MDKSEPKSCERRLLTDSSWGQKVGSGVEEQKVCQDTKSWVILVRERNQYYRKEKPFTDKGRRDCMRYV